MHKKLRALLQKQEAIVNAAEAAGRDLTEEEQKQFNALQAEIDQIKADDDAGAGCRRGRRRPNPSELRPGKRPGLDRGYCPGAGQRITRRTQRAHSNTQ